MRPIDKRIEVRGIWLVRIIAATHRRPHRGRRLRLHLHTASRRYLAAGIEGQLPRRGGWYAVLVVPRHRARPVR